MQAAACAALILLLSLSGARGMLQSAATDAE